MQSPGFSQQSPLATSGFISESPASVLTSSVSQSPALARSESSLVSDVARAFTTIFTPAGVCPSVQRQEAQNVLDKIRDSSDGWKFCLNLFHSVTSQQGLSAISPSFSDPTVAVSIRFWCIQVVLAKIFSFTAEERREIRNFVWHVYFSTLAPQQLKTALASSSASETELLCFGEPVSVFNKVLQLYVNLFYLDYPNPFEDALTCFLSQISSLYASASSPAACDTSSDINRRTMFAFVATLLKILIMFDSDFVSEDNLNKPHEARDPMELKDAMRLRDVNLILQLTHSVLTGSLFGLSNIFTSTPSGDIFVSLNPKVKGGVPKMFDLVLNLAMNNLGRMILWIDLPLVLVPDNSTVRILKSYASDISEGFVSPVSAAALGALEAITAKKMSAYKKIMVIHTLQLSSFMTNLVNSVNTNTTDTEITSRVGVFVRNVGMQVVTSLQTISDKKSKNEQKDENGNIIPVPDLDTACDHARSMLDIIFNLATPFLSLASCNRDAAQSVLTFLSSYFRLLKRSSDKKSLSSSHKNVLFSMLDASLKAVRCPEDPEVILFFENCDDSLPDCWTPLDSFIEEDAGTAFLAFRKEVGALIRQVAVIDDVDTTHRFLNAAVSDLLGNRMAQTGQKAPYTEIEAVSYMLQNCMISTKGAVAEICGVFLSHEGVMLDPGCPGWVKESIYSLVALCLQAVYTSERARLVTLRSLLGAGGLNHSFSKRAVQASVHTLCKFARTVPLTPFMAASVISELESSQYLSVPFVPAASFHPLPPNPNSDRRDWAAASSTTPLIAASLGVAFHPQQKRLSLDDHLRLFELVGGLLHKHPLKAGECPAFSSHPAQSNCFNILISRLAEPLTSSGISAGLNETAVDVREWASRLLGGLSILLKSIPDGSLSSELVSSVAPLITVATTTVQLLGSSEPRVRLNALNLARKLFTLMKNDMLLRLTPLLESLYLNVFHLDNSELSRSDSGSMSVQSPSCSGVSSSPSSSCPLVHAPSLDFSVVRLQNLSASSLYDMAFESQDLSVFLCLIISSAGVNEETLADLLFCPVSPSCGRPSTLIHWMLHCHVSLYQATDRTTQLHDHSLSSERDSVFGHAVAISQSLAANRPCLFFASLLLQTVIDREGNVAQSGSTISPLLESVSPRWLKSNAGMVSLTTKSIVSLLCDVCAATPNQDNSFFRRCSRVTRSVLAKHWSSKPAHAEDSERVLQFLNGCTDASFLSSSAEAARIHDFIRHACATLGAANTADAQTLKFVHEIALLIRVVMCGSNPEFPSIVLDLQRLIPFQSVLLNCLRISLSGSEDDTQLLIKELGKANSGVICRDLLLRWLAAIKSK